MALNTNKVSEVYGGQDISSLSDRPNEDGMTAAQLKARFDNLIKNLIPKHNSLIDALVLLLEAGSETNGHKHNVDNLIDGVTNRLFTELLKLKLDGIASGAEVNQNAFSSIKVGGSTGNANSKTATFEIVAGLNIVASIDPLTNKVTLNASGTLATQAVQSLIDDIGNYYNSLEVNGALQEVGANITVVKSQLADITHFIEPTGTVDDTSYIQDALNAYTNVTFKSGTYKIDASVGINVPSNRTISFKQGAILEIIPNSLDNYVGVKIENKDNIIINDLVIIGERDLHVGTTGEWGHGLSILGSTNITINRPMISKCWGDGIYIGKSLTKEYCEDIKIIYPECDNNRRQGISVVSVKKLLIDRPILTNTNGALPEAGIDFEPNSSAQYLEGIVVVNPITSGNNGAGVLIAPYYLGGSNKIIDIKILNHADDGSRYGFELGESIGETKGSIVVDKPIYKNNKNNAIYGFNYSVKGARVDIIEPVLENSNQLSVGSSAYYDSSILFMRASTQVSTDDIGNFHVIRPTIRTANATSIMKYPFVFVDNVSNRFVKNCSFIDPVLIDKNNITSLTWENVENFAWSDRYNQMVKENQNGNVYVNGLYKKFTNKGATATTSVNLKSTIPVGTEIDFVVEVAQQLTIGIELAEQLKPNQSVLGKGVYSTLVGSSITLRKYSATEWFVVKQIGTWNNII